MSFGMAPPAERRSFPRKRESKSVDSAFPKVCGVDSRSPASAEDKFRGNDRDLERAHRANDASATARSELTRGGARLIFSTQTPIHKFSACSKRANAPKENGGSVP